MREILQGVELQVIAERRQLLRLNVPHHIHKDRLVFAIQHRRHQSLYGAFIRHLQVNPDFLRFLLHAHNALPAFGQQFLPDGLRSLLNLRAVRIVETDP